MLVPTYLSTLALVLAVCLTHRHLIPEIEHISVRVQQFCPVPPEQALRRIHEPDATFRKLGIRAIDALQLDGERYFVPHQTLTRFSQKDREACRILDRSNAAALELNLETQFVHVPVTRPAHVRNGKIHVIEF